MDIVYTKLVDISYGTHGYAIKTLQIIFSTASIL